MKYKVFVIHSPEDAEIASLIRRSLKENKINSASSARNGSDRGAGTAAERVANCDAVIVILSSAANRSEQVKREIESAAGAETEMIPFRIDTAPFPKYLEFYLGTTHWHDASLPPLENHLARLISAVRQRLGLDRERVARKTVAALIFGVIGILLGPFSLAALILGLVDLRAIARGKSAKKGRKYALLAVFLGAVGTLGWIVQIYALINYDYNPIRDLFEERVNQRTL